MVTRHGKQRVRLLLDSFVSNVRNINSPSRKEFSSGTLSNYNYELRRLKNLDNLSIKFSLPAIVVYQRSRPRYVKTRLFAVILLIPNIAASSHDIT